MSDFWNKRLGSVAPANVPASPTTYHPQLPGGHTFAPAPAVVAQGNPKAPSSMSHKTCPECGSGNYSGVSGDSTKMTRCYDCGYNPRFGQQSGASGLPAGKTAAASPSRQVSTTNNYQPGVIIGRIGE